MKKLIISGVLGLAFCVSSVSFAEDGINVFGVRLPIEEREVKDRLHGDYLSSNSKASYNVFGVQLPLVKRNTTETETLYMASEESDDDKNFIFVFGVKVPVKAS